MAGGRGTQMTGSACRQPGPSARSAPFPRLPTEHEGTLTVSWKTAACGAQWSPAPPAVRPDRTPLCRCV